MNRSVGYKASACWPLITNVFQLVLMVVNCDSCCATGYAGAFQGKCYTVRATHRHRPA